MDGSPEREKKRETGNEFFKRGEFLTALRYWQEALALAGDRAHLCFPILNNCTLAYLRLARWDIASEWALKALQVAASSTIPLGDAQITKANYRCALAHVARGLYADALRFTRTAAQLSPSDRLVASLELALKVSAPLLVNGFNACASLPRLKAIEATDFAELFAV